MISLFYHTIQFSSNVWKISEDYAQGFAQRTGATSWASVPAINPGDLRIWGLAIWKTK